MKSLSLELIQKTQTLSAELDQIPLPESIWGSYNPLTYASKPHFEYLKRYANNPKKGIFLGMNPGPWGMAQTGIPFGEIDAVKNWIGICETVSKPDREHPNRPIEGFNCNKSEVSGRRLWGLFADQFPSSKAFFNDYFVINYCPLSFLSETGSNITPDKLPKSYRQEIERICDQHLYQYLRLLNPQIAIGIGGFARKCLERVAKAHGLENLKIETLLHPSPASPIANREWPQRPIQELKTMGIL